MQRSTPLKSFGGNFHFNPFFQRHGRVCCASPLTIHVCAHMSEQAIEQLTLLDRSTAQLLQSCY